MLVLFDQGTPVGIRRHLSAHIVRTAAEEGWSTLSNGQLLRAAEDAGFDVLLTTDASLPYQQNLEGRRIAVIVLTRNRWSMIQRILPAIAATVAAAKPGSWAQVLVPDS